MENPRILKVSSLSVLRRAQLCAALVGFLSVPLLLFLVKQYGDHKPITIPFILLWLSMAPLGLLLETLHIHFPSDSKVWFITVIVLTGVSNAIILTLITTIAMNIISLRHFEMPDPGD
jgi:hypothetical protein